MFLIYFFICCSFIFSAINSLSNGGEYNLRDSEIIYLPDFNITDDSVDDRRFQYGHKFDTAYSTLNSGNWEISENGDQTWKIGIKSEGAYALKLQFNIVNLPDDSYFLIYNESKEMMYGPYTNNDLRNDSFGSPLIKGDLVIIVAYCQLNTTEAQIHMPKIVHVNSENKMIFLGSEEPVLV